MGKKKVRIVVSDADADDKDDDEDDGKEEKKSDGRWHMKKEDDAMDIFMHLYKKLHDRREKIVCKWREELEWGTWNCFGKFFRKATFDVSFNYIETLTKYYKIYWLLILPYNYEIRPYSWNCGGESMIENVFKYPYKENNCFKIIYDVGKYSWHSIKGLCICIFVCIALLVSLYVCVFFSNLISAVDVDNELNESISLSSTIGNNKNNTNSSFWDSLYLEQDISELYPICELSWFGDLSVLDLTMLISFVYEIEVPGVEQPVPLQDVITMYFGDDGISEWKIINYTQSEPVFLHLRNAGIGADIISVRGTASKLDMLQDLSLYMSIALLQAFSLVIPVTSLAPTSFVIKMVWISSWFEGIIDDTIRDSYDVPVYEYAYELLTSEYADNNLQSLYIVGHSLGGGISQAVGAQLYYINKNYVKKNVDIKSLAIAAPGMLFGSKKFNFDLEALYMTSIVIRPEHDIVSTIDVHGGLVQNLRCREKAFAECHLFGNMLCELFTHCHQENVKNPEMYTHFCEIGDDEDQSWTKTFSDISLQKNNSISNYNITQL